MTEKKNILETIIKKYTQLLLAKSIGEKKQQVYN